jgi:hypothetical protein
MGSLLWANPKPQIHERRLVKRPLLFLVPEILMALRAEVLAL